MTFDNAHRRCARKHAVNRAWERLGVILREEDLQDLIWKAQQGKLALERHEGEGLLYKVRIGGKRAYGVFNPMFGEFVTFVAKPAMSGKEMQA